MSHLFRQRNRRSLGDGARSNIDKSGFTIQFVSSTVTGVPVANGDFKPVERSSDWFSSSCVETGTEPCPLLDTSRIAVHCPLRELPRRPDCGLPRGICGHSPAQRRIRRSGSQSVFSSSGSTNSHGCSAHAGERNFESQDSTSVFLEATAFKQWSCHS